MSFKNFIMALLCLLSSNSFAQNIKGTIKSGSDEPIAFGNPDSSFGRSVRTAAPRTYGITMSTKF